jgi:anti-sigma B factor antagonist
LGTGAGQLAAAKRAISAVMGDRGMEKQNALIMAAQVGEVAVVSFLTSQVLDEFNVQQLGQELNVLVDKQNMIRLVINFSKIKFLSSAVLGKMISLNKKITAQKGQMAFCNINPDIMQVFKITRLDKLIPIFDDEDEAVKGVAKPGLFGRYR